MRINTAYLCLLPYCVFFYLCFCVRRILQATMTDAAESQAIVFDDIFTATQLNPEGKYFDKVNRVVGKGETFEADLTLDIASEIYPIREGDKFTMALASTLRLDGQPDDGTYDQSGVSSLLDKYEYGMSGKVFRYEYSGQDKVSIIASFGGLLMLLQGDQRHLSGIDLDQRLYCLIRKTSKM
eukprot:gb/GECG01012277.1/.p1 GENE.gb/GECG01012277.1/~~gb/GECG01012277.1/.p1  ORF type:complete len:182 (+),score=15.66 gb/GECG01012277.1/:1-546(+)